MKTDIKDILEVKNLVKTYPNVKAVDGISFSIPQGICFGLLGPNGAGKTTTIEVIEGVLSPDSGDILYKGKPRGKRFRQEVGIQFQNTDLPSFLTVSESLQTFRNMYDRRAPFSELIKLCHLEDILEKDNSQISGGQKQRLLLAMALANDPELVFLDEPTTGLDPQARRNLWDLVDDIRKKGKTIVLTTHYMEEAEILCDLIAIIDSGRVIAFGSPRNLLSACGSSSVVEISLGASRGRMENFPFSWASSGGLAEILTSDIDACIKELIKREVSLSSLTVRSMNLEDLFLKLTGKTLRD